MKRLPTLSQNFLRSPILVKRLIGHTTIKKTDIVYDIGAGSGVIASALAGEAKEVVAIEVDERLIATLRSNLQKFSNVTVLHADVMTITLPPMPYKVFANIPFSLSSQIVRHLCEAPNPPVAIYLIVQEQFARKLLPDHPGFSNQLGMTIGINFGARIRYKLRPTDFYPRPKVPTVLLELLRRPKPLVTPELQLAYTQFVTSAFTNPQKLWRAPLQHIGLAPKTSPSSLTLDQWVALFTVTQ
ncbi:MAG TPA: rRNA adenine dimethyltransferase family protein [Magnetospirillaceae bacterium]|nr:rRNA adenine dimethyltransferase family protein [Magnetospirillaceae bacterium]